MTILIEDAETLQYLTTSGRWTKTATEGKSFASTKAAFEVAKREPIAKFNIVCFIAQTRQFINLDHGRGKGIAASTTVEEVSQEPTMEARAEPVLVS